MNQAVSFNILLKNNPFITPNNAFQQFSLEHLLTVIFFTIVGVWLIRWAIRQDVKTQDRTGIVLSVILILTNAVWIALQIWVDDFNYKEDLPFHLCNVVGILTIFLAATKKYWLYEILFFWVMAVMLQAVVTPGATDSFPHYHYLKYWITHAGVLIFMLYATFVYKMRPTIKSVFKSYLAIQVYALAIYILNKLLGSNYFYLNQKPPTASLLDKFGDWPNYILVVEVMLIPYFLLIYLPFFLADRLKKQ